MFSDNDLETVQVVLFSLICLFGQYKKTYSKIY